MTSYNQHTDEELVQKFRHTGNSLYAGVLLERYTVLLLGVGMKYLKDKEQAADAVQQVFLKTLTALGNTEVQNFKGWLYIMMRNHCFQLLRDKAGWKTDDALEHKASPEPIDTTALWEQELLLEKMQEELNGLEEGQKECIRLFYLEKQSYQQIMEQKGYSFMQVKSHIQNGKRKLRILLEDKKNKRQ